MASTQPDTPKQQISALVLKNCEKISCKTFHKKTLFYLISRICLQSFVQEWVQIVDPFILQEAIKLKDSLNRVFGVFYSATQIEYFQVSWGNFSQWDFIPPPKKTRFLNPSLDKHTLIQEGSKMQTENKR